LKVGLETEGCLNELTTTNYEIEVLDNMATVTWDINVIIDLENKAEIEVDEPKIIAVEEIPEVV